MARNPQKICFFITPIGEPGSPQRKRADQVQRYILREVLSRKYKIVRADELAHPGSVTHQIISLLYNADLVIADLTGSNANVAYELAVRHAFNKVSIHIVDKADHIPFDLKDERTIVFDLSDPDSNDECKKELKRYISAITGGKSEYSSPVFRTLGVAAATAEEKEGFLDTLADKVDSLATDVSSLASDVSSIETTLTLSDLDEIDSIKDGVEALMKAQLDTRAAQRKIEAALKLILEKLG